MSIRPFSPYGIIDDRYTINAVCGNCRVWDSGSIDFNATHQPMIYAVGPEDSSVNSDAFDAGLRRHDYWGSFNINTQAAQGDPLPWPPDTSHTVNATENGRQHDDHEYASGLHAIAMVGTFVVIFPLGALYMRAIKQVRWHWITQAIGVVVVLVGAGLGLGLSHYYNRVGSPSRHLAPSRETVLLE
ncbi:MAG: hypothetical protein Q9190_004484 [Brigantiaea leucoxantha]